MDWIMTGWAGIWKRSINLCKYLDVSGFFCIFSRQYTRLKAACHILLLLLTCLSARSQQFYLRGEVKDETGNLLQNVLTAVAAICTALVHTEHSGLLLISWWTPLSSPCMDIARNGWLPTQRILLMSGLNFNLLIQPWGEETNWLH